MNEIMHGAATARVAPDQPAELKGALVFSLREGWYVESTLQDPLQEDFAELVKDKAQGFAPWTAFSPDDAFALGLMVYQRRETWPPFLVEIDSSHSPAGTRDYVWVDDLPSVMTLLREWAPVTQASQSLRPSPLSRS
jgi:hypothetical protein